MSLKTLLTSPDQLSKQKCLKSTKIDPLPLTSPLIGGRGCKVEIYPYDTPYKIFSKFFNGFTHLFLYKLGCKLLRQF